MANKYEYNKYVQGNFGFGWEDVCCESDPKEAKQRLKEYRENDPRHAYRVISRRDPIDMCHQCHQTSGYHKMDCSYQ